MLDLFEIIAYTNGELSETAERKGKEMALSISEKIMAIAKRKGYGVEGLAKGLDCSVQNVYLKFRRNKWSTEEIERYCKVLGVKFEPVFTDEETGEKF